MCCNYLFNDSAACAISAFGRHAKNQTRHTAPRRAPRLAWSINARHRKHVRTFHAHTASECMNQSVRAPPTRCASLLYLCLYTARGTRANCCFMYARARAFVVTRIAHASDICFVCCVCCVQASKFNTASARNVALAFRANHMVCKIAFNACAIFTKLLCTKCEHTVSRETNVCFV